MDNQKQEQKMTEMLHAVSEKYGRKFTVVSFRAALDETYSNVLTVTDGEYVFNVYQSAQFEMADDYQKAVVSKRFTDSLQQNQHTALEVYGNFLFAQADDMSLEYAMNSDIERILTDYKLLKAVIIVKGAGNIEMMKDDLYSIYKETISLGPKYIDFEVIQVERTGEKLENMLQNLPVLYDNDWEQHPEIKAYVHVTDTNIVSASELVEEIQ